MKALKKTLSLVLAVCILASMACVAAVSASANAGDILHRYNIKDIVNSDPRNQVNTKTFMFYMPESWRNTYNDTYDGVSLDSCSAGIYWWEGAYNAKDYQGELTNDWPGYAITETLPEDKNIFVAQIPENVTHLIWNNLVDGGPDSEKNLYPDRYVAATQTSDIPCEFYDPYEDGYVFYPNGVDNFDGMIYVCNPKDTIVSEFTSHKTYQGCWFYYYGNGEYGINKNRIEGEVYSNGEFPPYGFQVDETAEVEVGESTEISCNDNTATAVSADPSIATVTKDETTGKFTVTGVKAGTTTIAFVLVKDGELEIAECKVTVKAKATTDPVEKKDQKITTSKKSYTKTYGAKAFSLKAKTSGKGKLTYKTNSKKVATVSSKGKVTIKGCGKATITITATSTAKYKSATKKITVTVKPQKLKIKSGRGNKKAYTIYFTPQKTVSGYECTYKNGNKNHKITVGSKSKFVTLKNLAKGNCTVKIRAFKTVGKTKLYGAYGKMSLSIS